MTEPRKHPALPTGPESKMKCMCCGGSDWIQGVTVLDHADRGEIVLHLGKDRNPPAMVFKGRERSLTAAVVCGSCGFVHLFAASPQVLKQVEDG